ncbi:MAG: response regulator [Planctomycetaceae bacterium]|nr:response regulator [Planctomycetaceae bacterium]
MDAKPVLIVDDEKNIRLTLSQALETLDLKVDCAINGEEALTAIESKSYGLILLDLKMPGMDGIEVLRRIRQSRPDIKVIIITAHGTIEKAVEAMKLGAVDFIQKPFVPREIRDLVTAVLDRDRIAADVAQGYEDHIELAKKNIGQREFEAAQEHVRQAITADATRPEAFNLLGVLLEISGKTLESQKNYRAALALDPTYRPADENLSRTTGLTPRGTISMGSSKGSSREER